jgi:hypothetical protein
MELMQTEIKETLRIELNKKSEEKPIKLGNSDPTKFLSYILRMKSNGEQLAKQHRFEEVSFNRLIKGIPLSDKIFKGVQISSAERQGRRISV